MRVVAFWGAIAGLVAALSRLSLLVAALVGGAPAPFLEAARQVTELSQIAFTLLVGLFLLIVAVSDRKV